MAPNSRISESTNDASKYSYNCKNHFRFILTIGHISFPANTETGENVVFDGNHPATKFNDIIENEKSEEMPAVANFPIDIWHHMGKFVAPENVGNFALICRQTAFVTSTTPFWTNLYTKYVYQSVHYNRVPNELQRNKVLALRNGLRAKVIRSLFYTHKPLQERLNVRHVPILNYSSTMSKEYTANVKSQLDGLFECKYAAEMYSNLIDIPKKRPNHRKLFFNIRQYIPNHYYYVMKPINQRKSKELANIHRTEEIFNNPNESNVILFIKSMKLRRETINPNRIDNTTEDVGVLRGNHVFQSIRVQPTVAKKEQNVQHSNVTLKFQNCKANQLQTDIYTEVVHIDAYKWYEPAFDSIQRDEY